MKTFKFKNWIVTMPIEVKTFKEAKECCPDGFHITKQWEMFRLLNDKKVRKKFNKIEYIYFWCDTLRENKDFLACAIIGGGRNWNSYAVRFGSSDDDGRVVYIREVKN